jgi:hypothetical protein
MNETVWVVSSGSNHTCIRGPNVAISVFLKRALTAGWVLFLYYLKINIDNFSEIFVLGQQKVVIPQAYME